jgi:hypothetical protein
MVLLMVVRANISKIQEKSDYNESIINTSFCVIMSIKLFLDIYNGYNARNQHRDSQQDHMKC